MERNKFYRFLNGYLGDSMAGNSGINVGFGTAGQVLTSNGDGILPTFQNVGGLGGDLILLDTQIASGITEVEFIGSVSSLYDDYLLMGSQVLIGPGAFAVNQLMVQLSIDGGSSYVVSGYKNNVLPYTSGMTTVFSSGGSPQGESISSFSVFLQNLTASFNRPSLCGTRTVFTPPPGMATSITSFPLGYYTLGSLTTDAIRLTMTDSSIFSGIFSLYGLVAL